MNRVCPLDLHYRCASHRSHSVGCKQYRHPILDLWVFEVLRRIEQAVATPINRSKPTLVPILGHIAAQATASEATGSTSAQAPCPHALWLSNYGRAGTTLIRILDVDRPDVYP
jgi:hypothetical protein